MMQQQPTIFTENKGRVYKCGSVAPSSDKSQTVPLITHLCTTTKGRNFKKAAWKRRISRGQISVDGFFVQDPEYPLAPGSRISYHRSPWVEPVIDFESDLNPTNDNACGSESDSSTDKGDDPHRLHLIYRDEHMMAVHKPSGLPTMPSQTYFEYSVLNVLRKHCSNCTGSKDASNINTFSAPPQPVHRLGVGTSGVLLIATSLESRNRLSAAIRDKHVKKIYRALVVGADIPDKMTIDCPIGPVPFPITGDTIHAACPVKKSSKENETRRQGMKDALSFLRVVKRDLEADTAIVEVEIPTGRPHQIRIHMAYIGHPLVGDPLYLSGGIPDLRPKLFPVRKKEDEDMDTDDEGDYDLEDGVLRVPLPRDCGYSLHAYQIILEHPMHRGEKMTFIAMPPKHLRC